MEHRSDAVLDVWLLSVRRVLQEMDVCLLNVRRERGEDGFNSGLWTFLVDSNFRKLNILFVVCSRESARRAQAS